jgi:hypothetical protein
MATTTAQADGVRSAAYQSYWLLRSGFTVGPMRGRLRARHAA